jgi:hypothetical protein
MTWCEAPPAIHIYRPAKAPVSFKRRLAVACFSMVAAKVSTEDDELHDCTVSDVQEACAKDREE